MGKKSFTYLIWFSILESWGSVVTFLGIPLAIGAFFFVPEPETVSLKWFVLALSLFFILTCFSMRIAWKAYTDNALELPRVVYVKEAPTYYAPAFALFVLTPSSLFSFDAIVSIYVVEDGVERLMGIGQVINVQRDMKIQVVVSSNHEFGSRAELLLNNSKDELERLIVKPSLPSRYLESIQND